jgi:hypothetical protein
VVVRLGVAEPMVVLACSRMAPGRCSDLDRAAAVTRSPCRGGSLVIEQRRRARASARPGFTKLSDGRLVPLRSCRVNRARAQPVRLRVIKVYFTGN